ncbi:MAG: NAD-binding protein [Chloroflexi bacterium]|nr:NAD-binding protein [Chloroflexota bacterium]
MYAVIVGGGKVGYYLAKALVYEGHEVLVLENEASRARVINEELGAVTMRGNGCDLRALEAAGVARADVLVAATGDDEINLIACQIAKARFQVPRTIARINNPKNETIFKKLGVDATVSTTDAILTQIQAQLPAESLVHLLSMRSVGVEIVELKVPHDSPALMKSLKVLALPQDSVVALLIRKGEGRVPSGSTVLEADDELVVVTSLRSEGQVRRMIMGGNRAEIAV